MLDVTLKGYMTPKYTIHASSLVITFFRYLKFMLITFVYVVINNRVKGGG